MATVIEIENLGKGFMEIMGALEETARREIGIAVQGLPFKFEAEAKRSFTDVLNVISGQLRGAITAISRRLDENSWEIGLRDDKIYARIQHEGGRIPAHVIVPRIKKALFWPGARHPVRRVNHPGSFIPATKFLENPIRRVMKNAKVLILSKIKWKA